MKVRVGKVTHYYKRIGVAVVELKKSLNNGDRVLIRGKNTNFSQFVSSMEIEHEKVQAAGAGMEVALKVEETVRDGDVVYTIEAED